MYHYLIGTPVEISSEYAVLDVHDVGYEILMTSADLTRLSMKKERVKIYTYYHVREDVACLFGFLVAKDREVFELLKEVSGIGPKTALGIMGAITSEELALALETGDVDSLTRCPGVGKKTAQRMVLELSGKLVTEESSVKEIAVVTTEVDDAVAALTGLGFSKTEVDRVLAKISNLQEKSAEEIIKTALTNL